MRKKPYSFMLLRNVDLVKVAALIYSAATVTDETGLRAVLADLQRILGRQCRVLLAVSGWDGRHPELRKLVNISWSDSWLELYAKYDFGAVDPLLWQPAGVHCWSELIRPELMRGAEGKRMLAHCQREGMAHGVSYISESSSHRVILSIAGRAAESSDSVRQVVDSVWPAIVRAASAALIPPDRLYELSPSDVQIWTLLFSGMKEGEVAAQLGMSKRTLTRKLKAQQEMMGAKTKLQLAAMLLRP